MLTLSKDRASRPVAGITTLDKQLVSRIILSLWLAAIATPALCVDARSIEEVLEALIKQPEEKDISALCERGRAVFSDVGRELPDDFDYCQPDLQQDLIKKELYASTDGTLKSLPYFHSTHSLKTGIVVPIPAVENALPTAQPPFIIELGIPNDKKVDVPASNPSPIVLTDATAPVEIRHVQHANLGCPSVQTVSHRGSPEQPENSIQAALRALHAGHNGVEIDIQQLRDGKWVVHHDLIPGRATYGPNRPLASMTSQQWRQVHLLDRHGSKTDIPAPFLDDLLIAFRANVRGSQFLNIEIKSGTQAYSCDALAALDRNVSAQIPRAGFMYSSRTLENLRCLRTVNRGVYLGLVIDPHPDSINIDQSSVTGKAVNWLERVSKKPTSEHLYKDNNNRDHLARTAFADIQSLIGPYYGFHIDYRDYWDFAPRYTNAKGRLMLYQLDDDDGLATQLELIREQQQSLPDAVIVDGSPTTLCGMWN